jgi:hypothetical protein
MIVAEVLMTSSLALVEGRRKVSFIEAQRVPQTNWVRTYVV